jgi:hypothetical protein
MRSPTRAMVFLGLAGAFVLGVSPALAQSTCPGDTKYVGQWVEHTSDSDITHVQCQEQQMSDADTLALATKMYPKSFVGSAPPTLPPGFLEAEDLAGRGYKLASAHHYVWDFAPETGKLGPSALKLLVKGGGAPGVPLAAAPAPTAKHKKHK